MKVSVENMTPEGRICRPRYVREITTVVVEASTPAVCWQEAERLLKCLQRSSAKRRSSMSKLATIRNERKLKSNGWGFYFVHPLCAR